MTAPTEHILVRSANWLGDAVMSTPALMRLREARPPARIALLCPEKLAGLWESQPFVDEVLTFSPSDNIWQVSRRLREKQFTEGLIFPNSIRSALEMWLAGIPKRIGLAQPGRSLLLTKKVPAHPDTVKMRKRPAGEIRHLIVHDHGKPVYPPKAHHVYHYLHLAAAMGASPEPLPPRIDVGDQAVSEVRAKFGLTREAGRPWFALNPGAEYGPAKRWPADRFATAARLLREKTRCRWLITGTDADRDAAKAITSDLARDGGEQPLNLVGKTSLRELAAVLKICDLVLTNDSGSLHLASAVGTPVTAIFGSTAPELTGPLFSANAHVVQRYTPCSPCFRRDCPIDSRCLREIEPDPVVTAAMSCLTGISPR